MKQLLFLLILGFLVPLVNVSAQDVLPADSTHTDSVVAASDTLPMPLADKKGDKKDIVKKGISFGPLPVIAFDQDKGFEYGALLNIYDFGDGSYYPTPRQKWYIEASAYTKGSQQYFLTYDTRHLIPNIRMALAATCTFDKAMDFYGFNGYQSYYDIDNVQKWKKKKDKTGIDPQWMNAFYRVQRLAVTAKADFIGNIWHNKLFWQGSYYFSWIRVNSINRKSINKGKKEIEKFYGPTLYDLYKDWGIIPESDGNGGITSSIKLGLMYDTRDYEAAPSKGIWTEAHVMMAPTFLGSTNGYYRYMATFRHYVPIVGEQLVFAYRLNYQGTIGNYLPYYVLPVFSNIGAEYDRDGIGGYRTVRGVIRDRVQGLDVGFYNAELRWKFVQFVLWKQNIAFAVNGFCDGAIVTRPYNVSYRGAEDDEAQKALYDFYVDPNKKDRLHAAAGAGLRFIMNRNFIIAVEYAMPFNKQDGTGSFYLNTGYLF